MEQHQILSYLGMAIAIVGGGLAVIGTTSTGLFIFYIALLFAGLGLVTYSKTLRDKR